MRGRAARWQAVGWQHDMWDLVRYGRSLRGKAGPAWLEELQTSGTMRVGDGPGAALNIDAAVVADLVEYLPQASQDLRDALGDLRSEDEALDLCARLHVTVSTTRTKNPDHHQSSSALVGAVTAIAHSVCTRRGVPLIPKPQRRGVWCASRVLHVSARNLDGAIPSLVNPAIIWEIKEYWGKTSGGSKMSDAVYECNLVGREIREHERRTGQRVKHLVFLDGREQWLVRQSDLLRFVDLEHQGIVDRLFVGTEVESEWEDYLTRALDDAGL